jgi:hypothetical protein
VLPTEIEDGALDRAECPTQTPPTSEGVVGYVRARGGWGLCNSAFRRLDPGAMRADSGTRAWELPWAPGTRGRSVSGASGKGAWAHTKIITTTTKLHDSTAVDGRRSPRATGVAWGRGSGAPSSRDSPRLLP